MARPSHGEVERLIASAVVGAALGAFAALLVALFTLGTPEEAEAPSDDLSVIEDRTDASASSGGPLWLPEGYGQDVVCDRSNRAYVLVTSPEGGLSVVPYLDDDGTQVVIPQS